MSDIPESLFLAAPALAQDAAAENADEQIVVTGTMVRGMWPIHHYPRLNPRPSVIRPTGNLPSSSAQC
jgi:hypothetical protein